MIFRVLLTALISLFGGHASSAYAQGQIVQFVPGQLLPAIALNQVQDGLVRRQDGSSTGQTLTTPSLVGGAVDGQQAVTVRVAGAVARTLWQHFSDIPNVQDFGVLPGSSDSASAILAAVGSSPMPIVNFPYTAAGYTLGTIGGSSSPLLDSNGRLLNWNLGIYFLNGNQFSGAGVGTPETGAGAFHSTYTNPWNITTGLKMTFDPAALPQKNNVTNQGLSIECSPNRPNSSDQTPTRHWIACIYRGADTGSGGASGTSISTEVDNDVLNVATNSGVGYELDVNFNGQVADGGISRGIFLTGGGATGNNTSSVALDIQHGAYDGSWLPWSTGISVRSAVNDVQLYKSSAGEAGFFLQAFDQAGNELYHIDKNGYVKAAGLTANGNISGSTLQTAAAALSSFGACSSSNEGREAAIVDSTTNAWGATISGGGSYHVLGYCDGSAWTVLAK